MKYGVEMRNSKIKITDLRYLPSFPGAFDFCQEYFYLSDERDPMTFYNVTSSSKINKQMFYQILRGLFPPSFIIPKI